MRSLLRSPALTAVALLSLALGIGANTAIFSFLDAVLLRNLPVQQPSRLVVLGDGIDSGVSDNPGQTPISIPITLSRSAKSITPSSAAPLPSFSGKHPTPSTASSPIAAMTASR